MSNPRLSKSGIEYLDYQWGIFSGCHNHLIGVCGGGGKEFNCWAQSIAYRFPNLYPDGFEPHYYPEAINSPMKLKKPSRIGVGWVGDVIGYGLEYKETIFDTIFNCPLHTFLFLTKNADHLIKFSPFPDNCWVGVTATDYYAMFRALNGLLCDGIRAQIKFISFEPLLESVAGPRLKLGGINWVIIGAQTKPYKPPKIEWIEEIVRACDKAGIPVFLKDNLKPLIDGFSLYPNRSLFYSATFPISKLRQEMPCCQLVLV